MIDLLRVRAWAALSLAGPADGVKGWDTMVPTVPEMIDSFVSRHPVFWKGLTISDAHVVEFGGVVPEFLLGLWRRVGFSGFSDGAFWLVDPLEWAESAKGMLRGIEVRFLDPDALLVPVARSAFGEFWFWSPGHGVCLRMNPATGYHRAFELEGSAETPDLAVSIRLNNMDVSRIDVFDVDDHGVFELVLRRLGPVGPGECYGFVPSVLFGLPPDAARAQKVALREHLVLLDMISRGEVSFEVGSPPSSVAAEHLSQSGETGPDETGPDETGPDETGPDETDNGEPAPVALVAESIATLAERTMPDWVVAVGTFVRQDDNPDGDAEDDGDAVGPALVGAIVAYSHGRAEQVRLPSLDDDEREFFRRGLAMAKDDGLWWAGVKLTVYRDGRFEVEHTRDENESTRWVDGIPVANVSRAELIEILRPAGW